MQASDAPVSNQGKKCGNPRCRNMIDPRYQVCWPCHMEKSKQPAKSSVGRTIIHEFVFQRGSQKTVVQCSSPLILGIVARGFAPTDGVCYSCCGEAAEGKTFCDLCFPEVPKCSCGTRYCFPVKLPNGHRVIAQTCLNCAFPQ
jgi:hypothetical protein